MITDIKKIYLMNNFGTCDGLKSRNTGDVMFLGQITKLVDIYFHKGGSIELFAKLLKHGSNSFAWWAPRGREIQNLISWCIHYFVELFFAAQYDII